MGAANRLLFLPGAGADPNFWRPIAEGLPAPWEKVHLGWPGLGDQPPHPEVNGIEGLVALVEAEITDRPVDLLAQSMGGLIALFVTLRHPARIRRLVLSVTSAGIDMARFGAAAWQETYHRNYPHAARWLRDVQMDLSEDLPRIAQPALLLWGERDPISPVAAGEYLQQVLPNAHLYVVPGGDHEIVQNRTAELAPLIAAHLT